MEFCRQALNVPADDLNSERWRVRGTVISLVRRNTHGIRNWTRGRTPLARGRVSRFRGICRGVRNIRGAGDCDAPVVEEAAVDTVTADALQAPVVEEAAVGTTVTFQAPVVAEAVVVDADVPEAWDDKHGAGDPNFPMNAEPGDGEVRVFVDISYLLGCEETWTMRIYPWNLDLGVPW